MNKLIPLAEARGTTVPFWLEDLLLHGPRFEQWTPPETRPNRVMLTEFLARWFRFAGIPEEEAVAWLLEYCFEVLRPFSKSGPSAIRHGTKCNTRYVYKCYCNCDFAELANNLPSPPELDKPPYMVVMERWRALPRDLELQEYRRRQAALPRDPALLPVKVRYREQYEKGLALAHEKRAEGLTKEELVEVLNQAGYLTATGRKWTASTLYSKMGRKKKPL